MQFSSLYYFAEWVICFLVYEHACIKDLRCKGARAFEKLKGSPESGKMNGLSLVIGE